MAIAGGGSLPRDEIIRRLGITLPGELPKEPAQLADDLQQYYASEGYSEASVTAVYEQESGLLTFTIDEGRIDGIEFDGIDEAVGRRFVGDFDVRAGDVFNRHQILRAMNRLLAPTEGAFRIARNDDRGSSGSRDAFELRPRDGKRVLIVRLQQRTGRFGLTLGTNAREDWYTPVDGFAPAFGFDTTIFDRQHFNHTFLSGYLSYKVDRDRVGYAFGFERPLFTQPKLFVGAELHDGTASDDFWRLSPDEQSLVALAFKNSFRDYYQRRGYQVNAALRFRPEQEVQVSWRGEHHESLSNETGFSFFRDDQSFRPNLDAQAGRLQALVVGYTWDSRGLGREGVSDRYRRHQLDSLYGRRGEVGTGFRVDWTSEIASPGALGGDFDFRRHIGNTRAYLKLSPRQSFNARFLAGIGEGDVPPQRRFALGGIGSVRGYTFKEVAGEGMALLNLEYLVDLGSRHLKGVALFDSGRVWRAVDQSRKDWLNGVGLGVQIDDFRLEFGWRLDDIPQSLQVLVRFTPTF